MAIEQLRQFGASLAGLAFALGLALGSSVQGKRAPRPSRGATKPSPIDIAAAAIFKNSADPSVNLHAACARSDFKFLALGLQGIGSGITPEKSEYETAAEYAERVRKLEALLNPANPIIVCQPLDDNEDAPFEYDAERQVFKGSFRSHENVWRDVKRLGSYVSKTRMGVSARVSASAEMDYDVEMGGALAAFSPACGKYEYGGYSYEVPVLRGEAPLVKARGYLVFIGRLVSPFIDSDDTPGSPTLDDPHDVYERDLTVYFKPTEAAVVSSSGELLWQCPEPSEAQVHPGSLLRQQR